MIIKQRYSNSASILLLILTSNSFTWALDVFNYFLLGYERAKANNEFKANLILYLRFGEISLCAFLICLLMCLTYKRTGKIC